MPCQEVFCEFYFFLIFLFSTLLSTIGFAEAEISHELGYPNLSAITCEDYNDRNCLKSQSIRLLHEIAGDDLKAFFGLTPEIQIIAYKTASAFAIKETHIFISNKLFKKVQDPRLIAFVLLHEIAHLKLHKNSNKLAFTGNHDLTFDPRLHHEIEADMFACELLSQGLNQAENCAIFMEKLALKLGNNQSLKQRAKILRDR
ncbi:MAG: M48 family metalloprotease [Bdellovibrionota bacterium]